MTTFLSNYKIEKSENGTFLYKSKAVPFSIKKPFFKDKPQFEVIYKLEDKMKESGKNMILSTKTEILKYLKTIT